MRRPALRTLLALSLLPAAPAVGADPTTWLAPPSSGDALVLPVTDPAIPDPQKFLGYALGSSFTPHSRILDYLDALSVASPRLRQIGYGSTPEGRPLRLLVITSPANQARLEELRTSLLRLDQGSLAEPEVERLAAKLPIVVWLSYGVHGNESSSAEVSMAAAYLLAAAQGDWERRLDDLIVLIDPLVNPDGRERYVQGFAQRKGRTANLDPDSSEHLEGWPSGRFNHYLFDLNRDWAWLTQPETRQRVALYRAWEPQVHVDFHEMNRESTYFFPPAAEPVNPEIDERIVGWLREFGRGNAAAFDRMGWPFYTRETYDLFYPGYGDAYPGLRGAIGMTYEVAGGGRAGTAVELRDGSTLRLSDRIARHLATTLATLETAHARRSALLADFAAMRHRPLEGAARTYLWPAEQPEARELAELLAAHGIAVRRLAQADEIDAWPLRQTTAAEGAKRRFAAGTYAVTSGQPLGPLVRALLEREIPLAAEFVRAQRRKLEEGKEPDFYDVTAWSLPLAWNLEAWVTESTPARLLELGERPAGALVGKGDLGVALRPQGLTGYRALARFFNEGHPGRLLTEDHQRSELKLPAGTVVWLARGDAGLFARAATIANDTGATLERLSSGLAERGASLGSESTLPLRPTRVALVRGRGVDATSFGSLWSLFDQELGLEHTVLELEDLSRARLDRYDALVLPDGGGYTVALGDAGKAALDRWVRSGGVLVAIGGAMEWAKESGLLELRPWEAPKRDPEAEDAAPAHETWVADQPLDTPGAILATRLRGGSPLTAGVTASPPVLFNGRDLWLASGDPRRDILVAADDPILAGFAWPEARQRLSGALLVTSQSAGSGRVVGFAQDPAFRGFWRATVPLLLNSVLFEPSRHGG